MHALTRALQAVLAPSGASPGGNDPAYWPGVSIFGDTAAVGAHENTDPNNPSQHTGVVHVFQRGDRGVRPDSEPASHTLGAA